MVSKIGYIIRQHMEAEGVTKTELARYLGQKPQNINHHLNKEYPPGHILAGISEYLDFNFFSYYLLPGDIYKVEEDHPLYPIKQILDDHAEIKQKLNECEKEKGYLKKINVLLEEKSAYGPNKDK